MIMGPENSARGGWMGHVDIGFEKEVGGYLATGELKHKETVVEGIDNAVDAFIGLFQGQNIGKIVVKMA